MSWNPRECHTCGDCGVQEGQLHDDGCDMERCPFCLGQNISCGCRYKHFFPSYKRPMTQAEWENESNTNGLPRDVYENGLPDELSAEWKRLMEEKGRIPHIVQPNLCARCGELWPDMFLVDDWQKVIPKPLQDKMLCRRCYEVVKAFMLAGRGCSE